MKKNRQGEREVLSKLQIEGKEEVSSGSHPVDNQAEHDC